MVIQGTNAKPQRREPKKPLIAFSVPLVAKHQEFFPKHSGGQLGRS